MRVSHPEPLDERAMLSVRRDGVEPPGSGRTTGLQPAGPANAQPTHVVSSTGGSRTHKRSPRFELGRFTCLRTAPNRQASPVGLEPTISTVTGWRALLAALRGRDVYVAVAQVGVEPTASLVLSQGGLPITYRAVCRCSTQSRSRTCKHSGLSRVALPVGVSGRRQSSPGWTRTTDPLLVRELPSPLGHRTVLSGLTGSCTSNEGRRACEDAGPRR